MNIPGHAVWARTSCCSCWASSPRSWASPGTWRSQLHHRRIIIEKKTALAKVFWVTHAFMQPSASTLLLSPIGSPLFQRRIVRGSRQPPSLKKFNFEDCSLYCNNCKFGGDFKERNTYEGYRKLFFLINSYQLISDIYIQLQNYFYGHLFLGSSCCSKIDISFKGPWQPNHKHYSGTFHMISSRPLLYKNNKLQLYITKDVFGTWVVSIVQIIFKSLQSWNVI